MREREIYGGKAATKTRGIEIECVQLKRKGKTERVIYLHGGSN